MIGIPAVTRSPIPFLIPQCHFPARTSRGRRHGRWSGFSEREDRKPGMTFGHVWTKREKEVTPMILVVSIWAVLGIIVIADGEYRGRSD